MFGILTLGEAWQRVGEKEWHGCGAEGGSNEGTAAAAVGRGRVGYESSTRGRVYR